MILTIKQPNLRTVKEVRAFLDGTTPFDFKPQSREDTYRWTGKTLEQLRYKTLGKADRGTVKAFLEKVSGLSRAQVTRLISQHRKHGRIRDRRGPLSIPRKVAAYSTESSHPPDRSDSDAIIVV